jgi:hypothetical protein
MKRLVSIGLLFLLIFQVAGYFSVFRLMQSGIRKEVFRQMESRDEEGGIVVIIIPADPEQAARQGYTLIRNREIIFKDVYYDIVRSEPDGLNTRYFCYADEKESRLAQQMNEHARQGKGDPYGLVNHLLNLALTAYLGGYVYLPDLPGQDDTPDSTGYFFSSLTWDPSLPAPPPRLIV